MTTYKYTWPILKRNTFFNICPHGTSMIIERFGSYNRIKKSGFFFAIPLIEKISYCVDVREQTTTIAPLKVITKDNVTVSVSGNLYYKFVDEYKACYGAIDPIESIIKHAQSSMRSSLGSMELDEILVGRLTINSQIHESLKNAASVWGIHVERYEVTELKPDDKVAEALNLQSMAERSRRESVLNAEGSKQSATTLSEGEKIKLKNESEGHYIKVKNEALAVSDSVKIQAEGTANAIKIISDALKDNQEYSKQAINIILAKDLIKMNGEIGSKSNTIFFNEKPADLNNLLLQASHIVKSTN